MVKLFSIKQKYSEKIYTKEKLVEFRRQNVNITQDELCLIYTSSPVKKINGYFVVKKKIRAPLDELWKLTKNFAGLSYSEFKEYFINCVEGTAIIFKKAEELVHKISLKEIQKIVSGFRPPQSYYNINVDFLGIYENIFSEKMQKYFNLL